MGTGSARTSGASFRQGALAVSPLLVGIAPFGLIAGLAAIEAGLGPAEAVGFSVGVFAGASQLAAIDLIGSGAMVWVAVLTALVINLRLAMYSASLATYFAAEPRGRRLLGAYLLTDQAFAVGVARFTAKPEESGRWWFYLGTALALWTTWQVATIAGVLIGDAVPETIPLGFAVPLAFVSLLVPSITDRPALAAAVTAGVVATAAAPLPANLGMPFAAVTGVVVGWCLARRLRARAAMSDAGGER